jgi:hypothetical protein
MKVKVFLALGRLLALALGLKFGLPQADFFDGT